MAEQGNRATIKNPIVEDMIAQGRLKICPYKTAHKPVTADVNFDALHTRLHDLVTPCYTHWDALLSRYCFGSLERATADITSDVSDMIAFALLSLYNRLRSICQRFNLEAFTTRMGLRAPVASTMRYPDYLCRLLNGVGWLRVDDRPLDYYLHFVVREGAHYGWTKAQTPNNLGCERLITNLIACGVKMSSIDTSPDPSPGSWWPTCRVEVSERSINVMGTFHRSHYTMDDAFFATALKPGEAELPFQDFSLTAEYGYDDATHTALASTCPSAAAIPRRAVVDDGEKDCTRYYSCYLLKDASDCEIDSNMLTEFRSNALLF